jgi:protoheme IX farnesyltransferase
MQAMTLSSPSMETSLAGDWGGGSVADYVALLKPRVMSLAVFTAFVGMVCAPGHIHPVLGAIALICIAVGAGAAGALNMWYDADIDARMARTAGRPIPRGAVSAGEAFGFGLTLAIGAVTVLDAAVSTLAAGLLGFTIFYYVVIYTMWLKRWTAQNIVIGGAAGALPPTIGWAVTAGALDVNAFLLFLVVFLWTPPHFWALALNRSADYERAGVPMLPVVAGTTATRRQILAYTLLLVIAALLPLASGLGGAIYGVVVVLLNGVFVALAAVVAMAPAEQTWRAAARRLFGFSILYLFLLFATLLAEHVLPRVPHAF